MARACGLATAPVMGGMMGLAVGSTRLDRGRVETYPFRLPLSVRDRVAFIKAGLRVQRAVARYHRLDRRHDFDDDRTFGEFLGPLPPAVHEIFSCAAHRATADAERRRLVETTVEASAGRVPVVAGTGALSTRETVELSVHAERTGAAAVMIVPPFYDAPSWPELLAHYTAVADAIEVPIMYYNLPSASGVTLTAAQLRELPVTCLKDTGGDAVAATELIQTDGPTLLNGWDTLTLAALAAGARAVVWGVASIVPEPCVELHRLLIDDIDLPAARELWARLWPLCRFLEGQSYPAAVKTACRLVGDTTNPVRAPLLPLDAAATSELATLLDGARLSAA